MVVPEVERISILHITPKFIYELHILRHAWTAVWPVSEFEGEGQHIKEVKYGCVVQVT